MSINRPTNERLQLYERFKKSLQEGNDNEFFDADDLVVIIDQAVDLEDEYVQIEALMRGYRFFPENEELANRRAFLYYDLNLNVGVQNMIKHKPDNSPMWEILRLRIREGEYVDVDNARATLESLLNGDEKFDDETVIQFVDCASASGLYEWLKKNENNIRKKTDYLPTLLYELFIISDINSDYEYGIKLLEELTEIEPFNGDFWTALAQTQDNADLSQAALMSIEYALAIDSENLSILSLKASILIRLKRYDEALSLINSLPSKTLTPLLGALKAHALFDLDRIGESCRVIEEFCKAFPDDRRLVESALCMNHYSIDSILNEHYEASSIAEQKKWEDWARSHYLDGRILEASKILQCLRKRNELTFAGYKALATALLCSKSFVEATELLNSALDSEHEALVPDVIIAGLVSHAYLNQKSEAQRVFEIIMTRFPLSIRGDWTLSSTLESIGFSSFLGHFNTLLEKNGPIDVNEIDIFHFPFSENYNND